MVPRSSDDAGASVRSLARDTCTNCDILSMPDGSGTAADRTAWAHAISKPGARTMLLPTARHPRGRRISLDHAVSADRCHAVEIRPDLVVVDLDTKAGRDPAAVTDATWQLAELADLYGVPWVVTDSGGGGHHLYLTVGDSPRTVLRQVANACRAVPLVDVVRAGSGRIRTPGTRHSTATTCTGAPARVRVVAPDLPAAWHQLHSAADPRQVEAFAAAVVANLVPITTGPRQQSWTSARPRRDLSSWARKILDAGEPPVESRSQPAYGVLADVIRAGWTFDEFVELVHDSWLGPYHASKEASLQVRLAREWERAQRTVDPPARMVDPARPLPPLDRLRVELARSRGIDARWWRVGGHAVLDVVLDLAAGQQADTVHLSVRAAAELAGMSRSAAHRHLHRLEECGLIAVAAAEQPSAGRHLTVRTDAVAALLPPPPGEGEETECPTSQDRATLERLSARGSDVFVAAGLGHSCWRVWAAQPLEAAGIVGISAGWVAVLQQRLARAGLDDVQHPQQLAEAALQLGTAGTAMVREQRHLSEREAFVPVAARQVAADDRTAWQLTLAAA